MDFESLPFAVLSLQSPIISKIKCRLTLCHHSGRGANKQTCMSTHKRKESIILPVVEGITMECTGNIMPGKAASMLKESNSEWSCQTGNRIRNKWDGIQCDQMQNAALKQR